jgi:carbon-monoxide dehydrogenase medium subunit
MYPGPFEYAAAPDLSAALHLVSQGYRPLAGGQSLIAAMNLRLAQVDRLVDIGGVAELQGIEGTTVGALTRHHQLATSAPIPLLREAAGLIGNLRVRHRGTLGGSLSHADPAAELPAAAVCLDARVEAVSLRGSRVIPARGFFLGYFTTALREDELLKAVRFPPVQPREGHAFVEFARRAGDFAVVGIAARVVVDDGGRIREASAAATGVGAAPVLLPTGVLLGERPSGDLWRSLADACSAAVDPESDATASAAYRTHLTGVLTKRAFQAAYGRAS